MVRKQLYLTRAQDRALKERARQERRTEADLVREALDRLLSDGAGAAQAAADDLRRTVDEINAAYPTEPRAPGEGRGWTRDELYEERESRWIS